MQPRPKEIGTQKIVFASISKDEGEEQAAGRPVNVIDRQEW